MKSVPLEADRWRVFLDTSEYQVLLQSAYSNGDESQHRVRTEMRLMACSLRVDTASHLVPAQFEKRETPEGEFWVVRVEGKDSTDREAETRPRAVYVPEDIMADVQKIIDRHNLDAEDPLFPKTTRTVQRNVKRSAENAATRTANEEFTNVSAHDLRRYFATHLLFRHEVPAPVVRMLGGWKSDEAMHEYLVLPDDVLFTRLGESGLLGTSYDMLAQRDHREKIEATAGRLQELLDAADTSEIEAAVDGGLGDVVESIDAVTSSGSTQKSSSSNSSRDGYDPSQRSMDSFFREDDARIDPGTAAKAAYVTALVSGAYSVTLAPLL
jgi:hypothetical protein